MIKSKDPLHSLLGNVPEPPANASGAGEKAEEPAQESKKSVEEFFSMLLQVGVAAQMFHWETTSYAKHMALGEFYAAWSPLVDDLVECYMGCYGAVQVPYPASAPTLTEPASYLQQVKKEVCCQSVLTDSHLVNIIDELTSLLSKTIYKLNRLN